MGLEVYLSIERGDVLDLSQLRDFGLYVVGQGDGREDGKGARLKAHCKRS